MSQYSAVCQHYWDRPGGGQLVCAAAAQSLNELGLEPVLVSSGSFRPGKYEEWFGIKLDGYKHVQLPVKLKGFFLLSRLFFWIPINRAIKLYHPRLIFTDEGTYAPSLKLIRKSESKLLEYIHFPFEAMMLPKFKELGFYSGEDKYFRAKYGHFPMSLYMNIFQKLLPHYMRRNPFENADIVVANSQWTAEIVRRIYGENPVVVNPPIALNSEMIQDAVPLVKRRNAVVMVGRFSPEKRYHWVISNIFPKLKEQVKDLRLYIAGGARSPAAFSYISQLEELGRKSGYTVSRDPGVDADLYIIDNPPREKINDILDSSKAFLHATGNEHWGIAVVEAMARGLPAIVHMSGGAWSDVLEKGKCGFGYNDEDECIERVLKVLSDQATWKNLSAKALDKADKLTFSNFSLQLGALLKDKHIL